MGWVWSVRESGIRGSSNCETWFRNHPWLNFFYKKEKKRKGRERKGKGKRKEKRRKEEGAREGEWKEGWMDGRK